MSNLLIVDFRRVLKDKLLMVMGILAVVFSLFNGFIMGAVVKFMDEESMEMMGEMGMGMSAVSQFFGAFSFDSNVGLIAPVLLSVILCKDFSSGTIRNKIIAGYSRVSILLSMFIVCLTVLFGVILVHGLLTLAICLIFMPFYTGELSWGFCVYFISSLGLEFLLYVMVAALICWLCATRKKVGLVIVLYVAIMMILSLMTGILEGVAMTLEWRDGYDTVRKLIDFVQSINVVNFAMNIGKGSAYEWKELLRYILVPVGLSALLLGLGILKFKKKDLK